MLIYVQVIIVQMAPCMAHSGNALQAHIIQGQVLAVKMTACLAQGDSTVQAGAILNQQATAVQAGIVRAGLTVLTQLLLEENVSVATTVQKVDCLAVFKLYKM